MKNYKVYFLKNKHKDIVYCGLTGGELKTRFDAHVVKHKLGREEYSIELVQEYLTLEQAAQLERMLISQHNLIEVGLNRSPGSINGCSQLHSERQKKKWSEERKGKSVSSEHAAKNRTARLGKSNSDYWHKRHVESHSKPVMCVETGEVFSSARIAAKKLNLQYSKISLVCNGKRNSTGGLHFIFHKKQ
jgi:predicted GIY-YIG superfamily endonuclease